jgi:hypothetical protein
MVASCSKLAFAGWWVTTAGPRRLKLPNAALDHRRFWQAIDRVAKADLKAIETEIGCPGGPAFALGSVACSMSCRSEAAAQSYEPHMANRRRSNSRPPTDPPATTFADHDGAQERRQGQPDRPGQSPTADEGGYIRAYNGRAVATERQFMSLPRSRNGTRDAPWSGYPTTIGVEVTSTSVWMAPGALMIQLLVRCRLGERRRWFHLPR